MDVIQDRLSKRERAIETGRLLRANARDLKTRGRSNEDIALILRVPESSVRRLLDDYRPSDSQQ